MSTNPPRHPPGPYDLLGTYLHLADGGAITPLTVTPSFWQELGSGALGAVGEGGRLVSTAQYDADWNFWEMHPQGEEFVCLLSGAVDFLLERPDGGADMVRLDAAGSFVLVPPGAWHTAKISTASTLLFITAGVGTQHRPA
jgi:hypothetical protein